MYQDLRWELEAIASDELADVLAAWPDWPADQARRLRDYLVSELAAGGMLSVEKARDAGQQLGEERRQARRVLARIARELEELGDGS
jgi:hypothetical protein